MFEATGGAGAEPGLVQAGVPGADRQAVAEQGVEALGEPVAVTADQREAVGVRPGGGHQRVGDKQPGSYPALGGGGRGGTILRDGTGAPGAFGLAVAAWRARLGA